jgi:hypothetical protein
MDRAGRTEPLQTSPFAQQLDVCLVYLDEAHTRGTDLKLPRNYRAAVTLGSGLVKDKLTQGMLNSFPNVVKGIVTNHQRMYEDEKARSWTINRFYGAGGDK